MTIGASRSGSNRGARAGTSAAGGAGDPAPDPADRLRAFVSAYLDYVLTHLDLVRLSETGGPGARYQVGAYRFWHRHTALLLAAARSGDAEPDPDALAHAVLAPLAAEHLRAVVAELGPDRVRAASLAVTAAVLAT